ncbi:7754_t:CDS:1, partial [Cetraspora pellucida]
QEFMNNNALVSKSFQSTITSKISSISSEIIESEFSKEYFKKSQK